MSVEPPPPLPPMPPKHPRRSRGSLTVVVVAVVVVLAGAAGSYFFVLAPKLALTEFTQAELPLQVGNTSTWQYNCTVVVKNSGYLTGKATIVCNVTFEIRYNTTRYNQSYQGELDVSLKGGSQEAFMVPVRMGAIHAVISMHAEKTWDAYLA